MRHQTPTRKTIVIAVVLAAALVVGVRHFIHHIGTPRVIGRAVGLDGTEMCIVQQCNWSVEPFTTSFVYRRPGERWGMFYYDHQDSYWGSSRAVLDPDRHVALFYRGSTPAVTFDWASETFTLHRWSRTLTGAQWRLPADWSPGTPLRSD